jgi:hypothetical protein
LLRFSIESNLAVAALDAGEVERAQVLMETSTALLGRAEMGLSRFNQANNRAELALACGDLGGAARDFREASRYIGATMPGYARDIANAGLGYCALEMGDLSEARRREADLGPTPGKWFFDPTTILMFRSRLLERRSQWSEAVQLLADAADNLDDRLVLAWLKIRLLQVRLMIKAGDEGALDIARTAKRRAEELCLWRRAQDFGAILTSREQN